MRQVFPVLHIIVESMDNHATGTIWLRWWLLTMTILQVRRPWLCIATAGGLSVVPYPVIC